MFILQQKDSKPESYFSGWLHGMITMTTLSKEDAAKYQTRLEYKSDLAKLNRRVYKFKAIQIENTEP